MRHKSAPVAGANYKFAMRIEALDGGNNVNINQGDVPVVLDEWDLAGCFLQNVQYGENNYATSDVVNITMQIRYDNADHICKWCFTTSETGSKSNWIGYRFS